MKKRFWQWFGIAGILLGATSLLSGQHPQQSAPPQFVTLPILGRTAPTTLVNGHVVFVPTVANEKITNLAPPPGTSGKAGGGGSGNTVPPDFGLSGAVVPSTDSTCFANFSNNFDVACADDSYQGEPMLQNNQTQLALFGAENDIYPGNCSSSALPGTIGDCALSSAFSTDEELGQTWQRFKLSRTWGGHTFLLSFDPSVAVDSLGNTFVAFGFADSSGPSGMGAVMGVHDTNSPGGVKWTKTNPVSLNGGSTFDDKMWIAADAFSGSNFKDHLYIAWDRNQSNNQILMVASSSNQGQTWSKPIKVNDGKTKFERVIYAFPAVSPGKSSASIPAGTVYILWFDYAKSAIFMDHSIDGGVTWGTDVEVAPIHISAPGFVDIGCNGGRSMTAAPQMAIDSSGNIFVVFADQLPGQGHDFDIFLTMSSDGSRTWSSPVRATDTATGQQYNPAISIDSSNAIDISYLDRRDDANNCRTNTYFSQWSFSGSALGKAGSDSRVTNADSDFDGNPNGPGDYSGIATAGTTAHPYFTDHRDANATSDNNSGTIDGGFEIYTAPR
jgi:hypothetical protein